jgi:hypothetical protein
MLQTNLQETGLSDILDKDPIDDYLSEVLDKDRLG